MKKCVIFICLIFVFTTNSLGDFQPFGIVTVIPAAKLNGAGKNIDSVAFWETPNPGDTLLFVTGKANNVVEVWRYPFIENELTPLSLSPDPNGVDVDQDRNWLLVADARKRALIVFTIPDFNLVKTIGKGIIGKGETNLDVLDHINGQKWVYVSDNHSIHFFNLDTGNYLDSYYPKVESIEELAANNYYQIVYVPDEQGANSSVNPNGGIYAFKPDGSPFIKSGSNLFGQNRIFDHDEEGILIYKCLSNGIDDGRGFIIVSNQSRVHSGYEFFNRQTWEHLGTLKISNVSFTDGIASIQKALPNYPMGLFAAVNNDTDVALVGWDVILKATGLRCD